MKLQLTLVLGIAVCCTSMPAIVVADDHSRAVEPEAAQILRKMSEYLGSLGRFTLGSESTIDKIMPSGQKIQVGARVDAAIQRPNRLRLNHKGDVVDQEFYFDGNVLTLYGKQVGYYANLNAPEAVDMDTMLDFARAEIGVILPAADLFYQDAYEGLMANVESGIVVGSSTVGGVEVHHLAFRGSQVDWQIWIEKGDRPLPRKYLITSKWIAGSPQFTAVFSDWNTAAKLDDEQFIFSPPPEAQKIGFISLRNEFGGEGGQ
jgi:hypothetical protein